MAGSNLTAFPFIQERSEGTPGLWNRIFSQLSENIAEANAISNLSSNISTLGMVTIHADSNVTNYIRFDDTSGSRSDYILGSQVGGTADGLNIWDDSGSTMIASFSKQSVRFYQQVVGPVFDLGGALTGTYNAATFGTGADSRESRIQAAINQAAIDGIPRVYIPQSMLPYSASSISFIHTLQMIREGGDASAYDVLAYGSYGSVFPDVPVRSSTSAIQAAINTGKPVDFAGLCYAASNLSQSANDQTLYSSKGIGRIVKNANGSIISCRGARVQLLNLEWRGESATPAFTGNNVDATGDNFSMINCGSRWAFARAVKATGSHTQIIGTCDIYQTTDATAAGYDIEIGVSGTATLYHELVGIYSSQAAGGLLFVDTGSHSVSGGQFGKYTVQAGTGPAGVNGGKVVGARILGNVDIQVSSGAASACQFGPVVISIGTGTSGCRLDASNVYQTGYTLVNYGNANNFIMREVSTGGTIDLKFGQDSSVATFKITPTSGRMEFPGNILMPNNVGFIFKTAAGADGPSLSASAGNNFSITNPVSNAGVIYTATGASSKHQFVANGLEVVRVDPSGVSATGRVVTGPGSSLTPSLAITSELSLGFLRSGNSTIQQSYGTLWVAGGEVWAGSGISVGNATAGGTRIPAISSMSSLVAAFVVQPSASSFTVVTWAAAQPGDQILTTVMQSGAVSSLSSGLVLHSHCTQAGQIEFRLSNVSTLAQNQSSRTYFFTRITPF